ncbi:motility associated factor glycosyltransferase family protein, partial [Campylobacter coli]|uniref:motility associated factor glycosyltransferase family protein n=1 Tax=Campylobacter coli TaxID=195 RepID=UPI00112F1F7C
NFKNSIVSYGNDPLDALQGIEQFVYNLPQMITHPSYTKLLSKRKNLSDTAIIVSTGPSLTKQLPLLKKYASKATIFCADSSYPILAKHGIKPDYVCTHLSHKNIIFIGQDLAYAENGNSHPDDYQNSANYESQMYEHILTIAYGGNGKVETHSIWLLFKNWFENEMIPNTRKMGITTYNCTEGGARIEGTIEKPFLWACENLLT